MFKVGDLVVDINGGKIETVVEVDDYNIMTSRTKDSPDNKFIYHPNFRYANPVEIARYKCKVNDV